MSIVCRLGRALLGDELPWAEFEADYRAIRQRIAAVVPGFADFEVRVGDPGGFTLPHGPRDTLTFPTPSGRARLTVNQLAAIEVPPGRLLLQTVRSHDQYNTTIYGLDDRYRGVHGGRRVVFVHADDLATLGIADGTMVDIVSEWTDGSQRRARDFRVVAYPTARGCAATYFPEANVLVPLDSTAEGSQTPTSKQIIVRLEARRRTELRSSLSRARRLPAVVAAAASGWRSRRRPGRRLDPRPRRPGTWSTERPAVPRGAPRPEPGPVPASRSRASGGMPSAALT